MKSRTRKLAWLLSATMVITSMNPGMMAMASEETDVIEQTVEETSEDQIAEETLSEEAGETENISEDDVDLMEEITDENAFEEETETVLDVEEYVGEESAAIAAQDEEAGEQTVKSISMVPQKTEGYAGLDSAPFDLNPVTITYGDDVQKLGYINGSGVYLEEDHSRICEVYYQKKDSEETLYGIGDTEGTYAVEFILNGKIISATDYFYQNKAVSELPKLTAGEENLVHSNDDPDVKASIWYEFTPSTTGKYLFDRVGNSVYVRKKKDGQIEFVASDRNSFKAKEGETYYIKFDGTIWNNGNKEYEWTTSLSTIKEIQSVDNIAPRRTKWAAGIEDDLLDGTIMNIHYTDGTYETVTVKDAWNTVDSQGNRITFSIKKENDVDFDYNGSSSITVGKYGYDICVIDEKVGDTGYIYNVVDAATADYPMLSMGQNTVTTGADYTNWYKFIPEKTGRYRFGNADSIIDLSGNRLGTSSGLAELTQGNTYYVGFYGRYNYDTGENEVRNIKSEISRLDEIVSVSDIGFAKAEFYTGVDQSCFEGMTATVHFQNGDTSYGSFHSEDGEYRRYLSNCEINVKAYLKDGSGKEYNDITGLPAGTYEVGMKAVDLADKTKVTEITLDKTYTITIKDISQANLPEMKEGDNIIQSGRYGQPNWYSFTAPESVRYFISKYEELTVLKATNDGVEAVEVQYSKFEAEKDAVYYIGFSGSIWDDEGEEDTFSWNASIIKVNEIREITGIRLARNIFAAEADWGFIEGAQIDVTYQNKETSTLTFTDTTSVTDQYGTIIEAYFDGDDIEDNSMTSPQKAGTYKIVFREDGNDSKNIALNSELKESAYTITVNNVAEVVCDILQPGENEIESSGYTGYANWYSFTPENDGRYYITKSDRYDIYVNGEEGLERITFSGSAFPVETGKTYYIGFTDKYSGTTELIASLAVTNITAKATKDKFYAGINQNHVHADVTVTYEGGKSGNLDLEEWYSNMSFDDYYDYLKDAYGNTYKVSLKSLNEDDYDDTCGVDEELHAGNYRITIQWNQGEISDGYDIVVENLPNPAKDASIPVTDMTAGKEYAVSLNKDTIIKWFRYTPQSDCKITFESTGDYDSYVSVYNKDGEQIDGNDDGGDNSNFKLERKLTAGQAYYFMTKMYNSDREGTFYVSFKVEGETPVHIHTYVEDRKEATCTAAGYTQQKCNVCGEVKAGSYAVIPAKGHSFGNYQITTQPTVLAEGVQTRTCTVCGYTENAAAGKLAANVTLSSSTLPLQVKQSVSLAKLIIAMTTGDRLVSCTTSNKKIATVNNAGKVTGKKAGKAKITMNFASGLSKTVTVKVQKAKVATSKITNVPGKITLKVKKTYKLSPVIAPITTKDKASYKSANKKVATVAKNGKITAKKAGKTTITVKVGKKTKKVKVTVTK